MGIGNKNAFCFLNEHATAEILVSTIGNEFDFFMMRALR